MVRWWKPKRVGPADEGLDSPLLPHGSEDDPTATDTTLSRDYSGPLHHPEVTAATYALSNDNRRRRSSTTTKSAAAHIRRGKRRSSLAETAVQRRQRRMQNIQQLRELQNERTDPGLAASRNYTEFRSSSYSSEVTSPTSNRISSISRCDSEMTDYGPDPTAGDSGEDVPREPMTWKMMGKVGAVILVTMFSIGSYGVGVVGLTMLSAPTVITTVVGVAGGVTLLTTPLVWVSEWRLTHMPTLRQRVNDLRELAKRFELEIDMLKMETEDLEDELEFLKGNNHKLEILVKKENRGNVDELVELVQENQDILSQMKENIRQVVIQDVVKLVLRSDINHDLKFSRREANILATRLSLSMQIYGIVFDEQKFHRAVGLSPSIYSVIKIVKRLLPDENDRLSSFYSIDSCSEDEEEDCEVKDDVFDMFYVPLEEQMGRGDSESIQLYKEFMSKTGEQPMYKSISPSMSMSVSGLRSTVGV